MTDNFPSWKLIEIHRRMTPQQRLQTGFDLSEIGRILLRLKVRHQNPEWGEKQVGQEVRRRLLYKSEFDHEIERICSCLCEELIR